MFLFSKTWSPSTHSTAKLERRKLFRHHLPLTPPPRRIEETPRCEKSNQGSCQTHRLGLTNSLKFKSDLNHKTSPGDRVRAISSF
ncbi:hypothetical protein TNCT_115221 [Trichonephila clavata]|uniref:Uncharacterized protein n=1 Tax=Trichonephila clavata TaxID=2740835 RepID=A0A8X6ILC7_TRICU|nr:hypothetical protein TNCT_115221 [Trichonephila clavata]